MNTCLTIAGSDPSGGAGIQADLKTFAAHKVYGMSVITALTAQNTLGVTGIRGVPADFIKMQLEAVFSDIFPDAVKIGMLSDPDGIRIIADTLQEYNAANIVVDPVMVSTSGSELISENAKKALCDYLLPLADIITPNIPEAEALTGLIIKSHGEMLKAAKLLERWFGCAVLIKGGHALFCDTFTEFEESEKGVQGDFKGASTDLLLIPGEKPVYLYAERSDNPNTHGTGCTLSSAIAAGLAAGNDLKRAVRNAKEYVTGAINARLDLGKGRGPLDHMYRLCENSDG